MRWQGLTRRGSIGLLAVLLTVVTAATAALGAGASGTATSLKFDVWSYSIPTIQDNIKTFQKQHPGVTVSLRDTSWFDYHDVLATRFTGGNAPDVAYSSDHWLREWVAAGWIVPLDKYFSRFKGYQKEWAPYALEGMTLDQALRAAVLRRPRHVHLQRLAHP